MNGKINEKETIIITVQINLDAKNFNTPGLGKSYLPNSIFTIPFPLTAYTVLPSSVGAIP